MPNEDGMGLAVDIACTTSQARYEMVDVAIKFFRRIRISFDESAVTFALDGYTVHLALSIFCSLKLASSVLLYVLLQ